MQEHSVNMEEKDSHLVVSSLEKVDILVEKNKKQCEKLINKMREIVRNLSAERDTLRLEKISLKAELTAAKTEWTAAKVESDERHVKLLNNFKLVVKNRDELRTKIGNLFCKFQ